MDEAETYQDAQARFVALIGLVPEHVLEQQLQSCPLWTPRQVLAHLIGVSEDFLSGNFPSPPMTFEEWTAAQVARRDGWPLDRLLESWAPIASRVVGGIRGGRVTAMPLINDTATHEQDVRGLAGMPGGTESPGFEYARSTFVNRLGNRIDEAGLDRLLIETATWNVSTGSRGSGQTLSAPAYEVFRAIAGRRSADQMRAFAWSCDPEPYIPLMPTFRMPERDVAEVAPPP